MKTTDYFWDVAAFQQNARCQFWDYFNTFFMGGAQLHILSNGKSDVRSGKPPWVFCDLGNKNGHVDDSTVELLLCFLCITFKPILGDHSAMGASKCPKKWQLIESNSQLPHGAPLGWWAQLGVGQCSSSDLWFEVPQNNLVNTDFGW